MTVLSRPDAAAQAALAADLRKYVTYAFFDFNGEPVRVTNAPYSVTMPTLGDPDLDGQTFDAIRSDVVAIGPIKQKEGGGDTLTCTLSGLAGIDDELMNTLGDRTKFQGRDARFWRQMRNPQTSAPIGQLWHYHTGIMSAPKVVGGDMTQVITLDIESYLTYFAPASNRTYLNQKRYDAGDDSARLSIAIANGVGAGGTPMTGAVNTAPNLANINFL